MAVGVILEFPNMTTSQYDQICGLMGLTPRGDPPAGALSHWAAVSDGGLLITDVWHRKERFEEFARDEIGPYSQQAGVTERPTTTFHEIHNYLTSGETTNVRAPVAVVLDFETSLAQYDEVINLMGLTPQGKGPDGILFHWATPTNGGVRVTDLWQDRPTFERFSEEQIGPYSEKAGVPPPTSVTFHDVYNYFTAGA